MRELSERLHILISPEQAAELRRLAAASGRPVGQLVREALDQAYGGARTVHARAALRRVASTGYIIEGSWDSIRNTLDGGSI